MDSSKTGGYQLIKVEDIKEEQIWGPKAIFYEKKLYRDDKIAINLRIQPAQEKVQSEGGYQLHTHGDSTEIVIVLKGKSTGYSEASGEIKFHGGSKAGEIGTMLVIPPHSTHGVVSVEEDFIALAIFVPPPKERY